MSPKDFLAVAAIDFGTTYSGWAMCFRYSYESGDKRVQTRRWHNGENVTLKTSTSVLIKPDGVTLEAFGYKAEDKFQDLVDADPKNHKGYYFFKRFKMLLFREKKLTRETMLEAANGKKLPAMRVFKLAIEYLKDDTLAATRERSENKSLKADDIHWTLTVPAIWKAKAKNFMREAAVRAGILDENLTIVLEPEAASIYCKNQPVQKGNEGLESFKPGTKYIVVDCGGGTIDMSCHELVGSSKFREIHRVKGNDFGGTTVDAEMANLLEDIFGPNVWNRFETERKANYVTFFRMFEAKKRDLQPSKEFFNITLPVDLYELYEEENKGVKFQDGIKKSAFAKHITIKQGTKVQFNSEYVKQYLFGKSVFGIVKCVRGILKTPGLRDIKHLLLVGGYGESKVLQQSLREEFPSLSLIVPQEAGLAVLFGAVYFGFDTTMIMERVAPYTYGTRIAIDYDCKRHSKNQIKVYDGVKKVLTFKLLVKCNQPIEDDNEIDVGTYHPVTEKQKFIEFPIYAVDLDREMDTENTDDDDYVPEYADDPRCTELGKVSAQVTNFDVPRQKREFNLKILFGKTEIQGTVINMISKEQTKALVDFIA